VEPLKKISLTENQMLQKRNPLAAKTNKCFLYRSFPEKFETIVGEELNYLRSKTAYLPERYSKSKYIDS
jgi:hypothetical protein